MFTYFPTNYMLSSAVNLCLSAGGQIGQIERFFAPLRSSGTPPTPESWTQAWDAMALQQSILADVEVRNGCKRAVFTRLDVLPYWRATDASWGGEDENL
jgi:hypothetical protein